MTDSASPARESTGEFMIDEPALPLVGQQVLVDVLRRGIQRALHSGRTTITVLEGHAGSGKTRLLGVARDMALQHEAPLRVMYSACRSQQGRHMYAPFDRMLRQRFGISGSASSPDVHIELANAVAQLLPIANPAEKLRMTHLLAHVSGVSFPESAFLSSLTQHPEHLHGRACRALRQFLEWDAQVEPWVLLIDNMHHADEEAWDMLGILSEARAPVAIVLTGDHPVAQRVSAIAPLDGVTSMPIEALTQDNVEAMLQHMLPGLVTIPDEFSAALLHRSQGNPGTLRQLVFALNDSDVFVEVEGELRIDDVRLQAGGLPIDLHDAIRARLESLSDAEMRVLTCAAVVGEVFWDGAVLAQLRAEQDDAEALAEDDPLACWSNDDLHRLRTELRSLVDKGFLACSESSDVAGNEEYLFLDRHIRECAMQRLETSTRQHCHHAVARWLEVVEESHPDHVMAMLAAHWQEAGELDRAGHAYLRAAVDAHARQQTNAALRWSTQALATMQDRGSNSYAQALHLHGSLLTTLGAYDDALASFAHMSALAYRLGTPGKGGAALNRIARVYRHQGQDEQACLYLDAALTLFRSVSDLRGVAATLDDLAQIQYLKGNPTEALAGVEEALHIRRVHQDPRGEAQSLSTLGSIELMRGELDEAEAHVRRALELRTEVNDHHGLPQSHNMLGAIAFEREAWSAAIAAWTVALEQAYDIDDRRVQCFVLNNLGEVMLRSGRYDEAQRYLDEAIHLAEALGDLRSQAEVTRNLGELAMRVRDPQASALLKHAGELAEHYGGDACMAQAYAAQARFHAQTLFDAGIPESDPALHCFEQAIALFRGIGSPRYLAHVLGDRGYYYMERNQHESARQDLREAYALMRQHHMPGARKVGERLNQLSSLEGSQGSDATVIVAL